MVPRRPPRPPAGPPEGHARERPGRAPPRGPGALTLREAIPSYLADSEGRRKPSTIAGYASIFAAVAAQPWAGEPLCALDHRPIKAWIHERRAAGVSGATLNRSLCALSSLFRWAIREDHAVANPLARIAKYSEKGRERETYLDAAEARALVEAAPADFRAFLVCALATGMRKGEIQRLAWGAVDLTRRFLTVESRDAKSGRSRTIPLSGWLEAALRALPPPEPGRAATTLVFRTPEGEPFTDWQIRKRLDAAVLACEAIAPEKKPKVTLHVMRHTAASLMVAEGVPIFDVAKVLGHTTLAVTMRYAHFAPEAGRAAIEALDRALRPAEREG